MKSILLIILIVVSYAFTEDEKDLWIKFKLDHKKSYNSSEEELHRFKIFKENLKEITEHNDNYKAGLATYEMEINKFADITVEEFRTVYKMFGAPTFVYNDTNPRANEIDTDEEKNYSLDWREKGAVTPVKNQGTCGSCWVFSADVPPNNAAIDILASADSINLKIWQQVKVGGQSQLKYLELYCTFGYTGSGHQLPYFK